MSKEIKNYGLHSAGGVKKNRRYWFLVLQLILAVASFMLATQYLAYKVHYHPALGHPLFDLGLKWYWPWACFSWNGIGIPAALIKKAEDIAYVAFVLPQAIYLGVWLFSLRKPKGTMDLHGSATWADFETIKKMGLLNHKGVYVGGFFTEKPVKRLHYLQHDGPEHVLTFAPTRSGKGVGLIIPTLLSWPGSAVVFDIKGENWALTAGYRKSLGHKVLRFDPTDAAGMSACFNPLEEIRLHSSQAIPDVQNIASMIIDPDGKGLEDHWAKAGFAFIAGALLHVIVMARAKEKRCATLQDLCLALSSEGGGIQDFFAEMLETDHVALLTALYPNESKEIFEPIHIFVASSGREMMNKAEAEASGVVSTALVNLSLYRDPVVAKNIGRADFRINDLMNHERQVSLYFVVSPSDIDRLRPLIRLIINLVMRRTTEKMEFAGGASVAGYKHRLLMMLDEFTALKKLDIFERAIAFCAGYGVKLYIIVQDITQLNAVYGKDNALMANCHIRIAYAPNTIETAKVLSDMTGKTTVIQEKTSLSGARVGRLKNASLSVSEVARPLLTPDECMRLPGLNKASDGSVISGGDMLIFVAGQSPIYGRQILYFKDPEFMKRAKMVAPEQSDVVSAHGPGDGVYIGGVRPLNASTENPQKTETFLHYLEEVKEKNSCE